MNVLVLREQIQLNLTCKVRLHQAQFTVQSVD